MKVFVVHNIDGHPVKTFSSEANAVAWVKDQCQFWAKAMGEECKISEIPQEPVYYDCNAKGEEITMIGKCTTYYCQSGSEYCVFPMELE